MSFKKILLSIGLSVLAWAVSAQANYDESSIPPYTLPPLLELANGTAVKSADTWDHARRERLVELFAYHMYGEVPLTSYNTSYELLYKKKNALNGTALQKEISVIFSKGSDSLQMTLLIFLPKQKKPAPLFVGLNFYGNHTIHSDPDITITPHYVQNNPSFHVENNRADERSRGLRSHRWPVERILARGYGLATIYYGDLDPDYDDDFKNGTHGLLDKARDEHSWGAIAAWAWGLSRALDYFETDPAIDAGRITVIGHSRLGKAALWAGARDERFAMVVSNNSGCGGAALSRRKIGETVRAINAQFPHWFAPYFHSYNDQEDQLPIDQHMLLALMAPRPLYVASASEDLWADPKGEFLALYHALPVYRLYGLETLLPSEPPKRDHPVTTERVGYHLRTGKHDLTYYDWEQFLDFADLYLVK